MNDLIKKIYQHKKNDPKAVYYLMDLIDKNGFKGSMELKNYEDSKYTYDGNKIGDEEIIKNLFNSFVSDTTHYDYLDSIEETKLKKLYDQFMSEQNLDNKTIIIIKIYAILGWGSPLPFKTYNYILEDKLA